MSRTEILRREREKIMTNISLNQGNRAKWLTALMDIDDELEERSKRETKISKEKEKTA